MELQDHWNAKELSLQDFQEIELKSIQKNNSIHPISKLKKKLIANSICGWIITVGIICVVVFYSYWPIQICLSVVIVFHLWRLWDAYYLIKDLGSSDGFVEKGLLQELERQYSNIVKALVVSEKTVLFIYPIFFACAYILGFALGSGKSVSEILSSVFNQWLLVVLVILATFINYYLGRWMNEKAFGEHLSDLRSMIEELKST